MNIPFLVSVLVLAFAMNAICNPEPVYVAPQPAPQPVAPPPAQPPPVTTVQPPQPAPQPVAPPTQSIPNSATDQLGRTLTPRVAPEVPIERVLEDTTGALMNREGILQNALNETPGLNEKVQRWLRARERMERLRQDRERRAAAKRTADSMREQARNLRNSARGNVTPEQRNAMNGASNSLDQQAQQIENNSAATREQRQEGKNAEKELKDAAADVPDYIESEVDNALKEQSSPPAREAQERAEIGPDGQVIESPPGR